MNDALTNLIIDEENNLQNDGNYNYGKVFTDKQYCGSK